jgi:hypothetical protein
MFSLAQLINTPFFLVLFLGTERGVGKASSRVSTPAIESGNAGGSLSSVPSTELDAAVAELRDDTAEEATAPLADERVRHTLV